MTNQEAARLAEKYGYREFMIERYLKLFGDTTKQFLEGNDSPLPKTIRVNTLTISPQELLPRLEKIGIQLEPVRGLPFAFNILESPVPIGASAEYLLGYYMLQSPASMWAVEALNPQPGQLIIDMCAAPGGKTTLIAQLMKNQGALLAADISRDRMRSLRSNLSRLRVENTLAIRTDAAQLPQSGVKADAVLLDAPCTGEGLIPVDPSRKQSRTTKDYTTLARVQQKLILVASQLLRDGGVLVYSTCSFAPEENEEIIDFALRQCPLQIIDTKIPIGDPGLTEIFGYQFDHSLQLARRFYPFKHQMEGFFICKMVKSA